MTENRSPRFMDRPGEITDAARRGSDPSCSLILPVHDGQESAKAFLGDLGATPPGILFEVILVDDASNDGTGELQSLLGEEVKVLRNGTRRGFAEACGQGAAIASGMYLVFLSTGAVPRPGWLGELMTRAAGPEATGVVRPGSVGDPDRRPAAAPESFCLLVGKEALDVLGGLEEYRDGDEIDVEALCRDAAIAGYRNDVEAGASGGNAPAGGPNIESLLDLGEERFSRGNLRSAVKIFERALRLDGKNSRALNDLGVIQWRLGDAVSALETFQNALVSNPRDADALANLANALAGTGRADLLSPVLLDVLRGAQPGNPDLAKVIEAYRAASGDGGGSGGISLTEHGCPLLSVCCIAYNQERYVRACFDGILAQKTDFPVEIIIHDDASTDRTAEIVREYAGRHPGRIRPILQAENRYSAGRKPFIDYVLPAASGKYIAYCDGDDFWTDPLKLQKQVDFLEANPEYVVCYHNAKTIDAEGNVVKESTLPDILKRDFSSDELVAGAWIIPLTMSFRNVIREFPEELRRCLNGDTFLISLLGNFGKGKYLPGISDGMYRRSDSSVWANIGSMRQLYQKGVSSAWMCRYYKRIGQYVYAEYFRKEVVTNFGLAILGVRSAEEYRQDGILQDMFTQYPDIIDEAYQQVLRNFTA